MARPPRIQVAGGTYHLTARGNFGRTMFPRTDDRRSFSFALQDVVNRHAWICHGYCFMTTHYHLLVTTPEADLAKGMQRLNTRYATYLNHTRGEQGHVLQGRYGSVLVEGESHLLELVRYLALNPVRAGMCDHPLDWPWSSYRALVYRAPRPDFLTTSLIHPLFASDPIRAAQAIREVVEDGLSSLVMSRV
ncbi:MAG: transposase [Actinomycetota bacterium]|nr:transposase [Actinomycetota bacterium]